MGRTDIKSILIPIMSVFYTMFVTLVASCVGKYLVPQVPNGLLKTLIVGSGVMDYYKFEPTASQVLLGGFILAFLWDNCWKAENNVGA